MTADKNYGVTLDGRVVDHEDAECAYSIAAEGGYVSDEVAKQYGLPCDTKAMKPKEDKAVKPKEDKGR